MNTLTEKGIPIFRIGVNGQTIESSDDFETWYETVAICIAGNLVRKSTKNRGMFLFVYHVSKQGPSGVKYTTTKDERGDTNWRSTMSFSQEGRLYYNDSLMDVVHTALAPPRKASDIFRIEVNGQTLESSNEFETWYDTVQIYSEGSLVKKARGKFLFIYYVWKMGPADVKYTTTKDERGDSNWKSTMRYALDGRLYYNEKLIDVVEGALPSPFSSLQSPSGLNSSWA